MQVHNFWFYIWRMTEPPPKKARSSSGQPREVTVTKQSTKTLKHWPAVGAKYCFPSRSVSLSPKNIVVPTSVEATISWTKRSIMHIREFSLATTAWSPEKTRDASPKKLTLKHVPFGDMPIQPTAAGVTIIPDPCSVRLKGHWQLTANQSWQIAPEKASINWDAPFLNALPRRCRAFGTTLETCLQGFMTHMHKHANKRVSFDVTELVPLGAPVLLSPDLAKPILLSDAAFNGKSLWPRNKVNKTPFSFCLRDAYIVHPNRHTLENTLLPLILDTQPALGRRQLIILDALPGVDLTSGPSGAITVLIRTMDYLKSQVTSRKRLKADNIRVFILASVVSELLDLIGGGMSDTTGMVAHKHLRSSLNVSTILSDLPWDRVITCTAQPVKLPPGHKIGFWWTLCWTREDVSAHAAPLSHVKVSQCKFVQRTIGLLNRSRMLDLSFVPREEACVQITIN
jgi:hypothetical protein